MASRFSAAEFELEAMRGDLAPEEDRVRTRELKERITLLLQALGLRSDQYQWTWHQQGTRCVGCDLVTDMAQFQWRYGRPAFRWRPASPCDGKYGPWQEASWRALFSESSLAARIFGDVGRYLSDRADLTYTPEFISPLVADDPPPVMSGGVYTHRGLDEISRSNRNTR